MEVISKYGSLEGRPGQAGQWKGAGLEKEDLGQSPRWELGSLGRCLITRWFPEKSDEVCGSYISTSTHSSLTTPVSAHTTSGYFTSFLGAEAPPWVLEGKRPCAQAVYDGPGTVPSI